MTRIEKEFILPETGELLKLQTHQKRILNHIFEMPKTGVRYRTAVYSCPKKSGKTEIAAAVSQAWAREYGGLILSIANDKDQAKERMFARLSASLRQWQKKDQGFYESLLQKDPTDLEVLFNSPDAVVRAIPCDPYGEAGGHFSLTVWDELWAYKSEESSILWSELQPVPTVDKSMRFVTTYAGWYGKSDLLWSIYEDVVRPDSDGNPTGEKAPGLEDLPCYVKGSTFVYWDHEARMPWQTQEFLEQARSDPVMRSQPAEFLRLWENRWTQGEESFLDIHAIDRLMEIGKSLGLYNNWVA